VWRLVLLSSWKIIIELRCVTTSMSTSDSQSLFYLDVLFVYIPLYVVLVSVCMDNVHYSKVVVSKEVLVT
jgi:hypothetical protein